MEASLIGNCGRTIFLKAQVVLEQHKVLHIKSVVTLTFF